MILRRSLYEKQIESMTGMKKQLAQYNQWVQMLADGDLSFETEESSVNDELSKNLLRIRDTLRFLEAEVNKPVELNNQNDNETAVQKSVCAGSFQKILDHHQQSLKTEMFQKEFYGSILDAIPYSMLVSDADLKFRYINKKMADYLIAKNLVTDRTLAIGMDCSVCGSTMCGNENCARRQLIENGVNTTNFEARGKYYKEDIEFLKDRNGKNTEFVLELTLDQTPVMSVDVYNKREIERLKGNLTCLANGDLNLDLDLEEPDEFTQDAHTQFFSIRENMLNVKSAIDSLIENTTWITGEIIKGNLNARTDETKFEGSWKDLIHGMNVIIEKIREPLNEVLQVMTSFSQGNFQISVNGDYQGDLDQLKGAVNQTRSELSGITEQIKKVTGEISRGNLNLDPLTGFSGDYADISVALNSILNSLNDLLGEVNQSAEQVSAGAGQVSCGSQLLAQGATEQASATEELTASIAEITTQTKANARDANEAKSLASVVKSSAEEGSTQMDAMQHSMLEINQSSLEISKIIKVIDTIAFQTNILALNAAVEAARAGQHGKGFAVVAEEVRTLAARSADAAKETTRLIEGSISKVQMGTKIADGTADALQAMVDGVTKVTDLVGSIAKASDEQALEIAQISQGIDQVAQVVQQNSATSEESAAASEELSGQAELLKNRLQFFQLRKTD